MGGRAGLGSQAAAADRALGQSWFASYNVLAAVLAIAGAILAAALAIRRGTDAVSGRWARRLSILVGLGGVVLLLRGVVGVTLLAVDALTGSRNEPSPPLLLAIEPWFVLGGIAYLGMAIAIRGDARRAGEAVR